MAVYDFSTPWVSAVILNPDGSSIGLWTNEQTGSTVNPKDQSETQNSYPWVTEASVTLPATDKVPVITVQLEPPFEDGIRFLDETFEWGRSTLQVKFGYTENGDPIYTKPWRGTLLKPDINISTDVTITLHAQGLGGFSAARQRGGETPAEGETLRNFWTRIVQGPNKQRGASIDFSEADKDTEVKALLDAAIENYAQANKSDQHVFWDMARRAKCQFYYDNNVIKVVPVKVSIGKPPKRVFRLYHYPDGKMGGISSQQSSGSEETMVYPVLSLNAPEMAMWLPGSVRGAVMREVSEESRKTNSVSVNADTEGKTGKGIEATEADKEFPDANTDSGQGVELMYGDPETVDALTDAQQAYRDFANTGLQIEVETIGIPDMLPDEMISLYGAGRRFSGQNFKVFNIEHTVGSDGFGTNFTAISNVMTGQSGVAAKGPANTSQPDASPVDDVNTREPKEQS